MWRLIFVLFFLCITTILEAQKKFVITDTFNVNTSFEYSYYSFKLIKKDSLSGYALYFDSLMTQLAETGQMYNGKKIGRCLNYHKNGTIQAISNYDSLGRKNGEFYCKNYIDTTELGLGNYDEYFIDGKLNPNIVDSCYSKSFFFNDSLVENGGYYYDGTLQFFGKNTSPNNYREIYFYRTSIIKYIHNSYKSSPHGYQVEFYPNGQKKMESCYSYEYAKGIDSKYIMNGDCYLCRDSMFVQNVFDGDTPSIDGSGGYYKIFENKWYSNGQKEAEWKKLRDKSGQVIYEYKYYFENEQLMAVYHYNKDFKKEGKFERFDIKGKKVEEKIFKNDLLLKKEKFD